MRKMRAVQHNLMANSPPTIGHCRTRWCRRLSSPTTDCQRGTYRGGGAEARDAAGFPIAVKVQKYADVAYGWAMEDQHGIVGKLIANAATGELLGAHLLGHEAISSFSRLFRL